MPARATPCSSSGRPAASDPASAADQRADQAVEREDVAVRLPVGCEALGERRVLERQEQADIAGRRVERADEADDDERPELRLQQEADAGGDHQQRGADQQRAPAEPRRVARNRRQSVSAAEPSSVAAVSTPTSNASKTPARSR